MKKRKSLTTSTAIALASIGAPAFAQEATAPAKPVESNTTTTAVAKPQVKPLEKSAVEAPSTVKPALDAQKAVVKDADAKVATAEANVKAKETAQASAEKEVANANQAVKDAEVVASQVTPEKVAEVKASQAKNVEAQTANQKATEATNADLAKEKEALSAEQAKVASANAKVAETAKDVKTAEQAVANAQSAIDGSGLTSAQKDLTQAQADVKTTTKSVEDAKTAKANADKADANRAEAIKSAEIDVNTKNDAVKLSKEKLATATEHATNVASKVETAKAELKTAEDKLANVDTVTIADLTQFKKDKAEGDSDFMTDSGATVIENSSTKISEADKNKIVDFKNITEEQKQELALYNLKVVNAIRKNLGLSELELNSGSMKVAQDQMNKYIARNKDIMTDGHLPGDYFGENGGPIALAKNGTSLSMYRVKQEIYNVVMSQAFADAPSKWGHSNNIQKVISNLGASFGIIDGELYSINVYGVYTGSKIEESNDIPTLEKAVATAQSNLEQATTASENAKNALTKASTDYASALSLKTDAEKVLADAMAKPLQAQVAESNLRLAEIALENAKKRETKATEAIVNFTASLSERKVALAKAQAELKTAKEKQTSASQSLAEAQAELQAQEAKVDALNKQNAKLLEEKDALVKDAKKLAEQLQAYLDAPTKLATAKEAKTTVEAKLETAKAELKTAQTALETVQAEQKAETAKLAEIEAKYAKLVDLAEKAQENVVAKLPDGTVIAVPKVAPTAQNLPELNLAEVAKEDSKDSVVKTLPNGTIVAVPNVAPTAEALPEANVDELKKANDGGKANSETYSAPAVKSTENKKPTYSRVERAKSLPNTGENSSIIMMLLGAILGLFGFVTVRRKN